MYNINWITLFTVGLFLNHTILRAVYRRFMVISTVIVGLFCIIGLFPHHVKATPLSAQEIIKNHSSRPMPSTFRVGVRVKNMKRNKLNSNHIIWIIGKREPKLTYMFIDFEEPKDAKGLRFLFLLPEGDNSEPTKAFGYLPATGITARLKVGNRSLNIGGTGLTIEDFQGFMLSQDSSVRLVGEEKVGDHDCYVLSLGDPENGSSKKAWISKKEFLLVKSQELNNKGQIQREFLVKDFFTTSNGEKWARKEEILLPKERTRILVDQIAGVYNIEVPDEVTDPKKFGSYDWRDLGS